MSQFNRYGKAAEGQCSGLTYINNWPGNCTRAAKTDGLCGQHLAGKRNQEERRAESDARRARQHEEWSFIQDWRKRYPELVWGPVWTCPLCGQVVQVNAEQEAKRPGLLTLRSEEHQQWHGQQWLDYSDVSYDSSGHNQKRPSGRLIDS